MLRSLFQVMFYHGLEMCPLFQVMFYLGLEMCPLFQVMFYQGLEMCLCYMRVWRLVLQLEIYVWDLIHTIYE